MAYIVNIRKVFIALLILFQLFIVQCGHINQGVSNIIVCNNDKVVILCSDSALMNAPILPDNYLSNERNIRLLNGAEIHKDKIERLLNESKGVVFPKGLRINSYDLKNRYLPSICVYLVGKWVGFGEYVTPIIKCVNVKEKVEDIYLLVLNNGIIIDALLVASVSEEYDQYDSGPLLSERLSSNTVTVFSISPSKERNNEKCYRFSNSSFSLL